MIPSIYELHYFPIEQEQFRPYKPGLLLTRRVSLKESEILEVGGNLDSKTWEVKRKNGEIGVVPSEYLRLISAKEEAVAADPT
jgi:hypothetical protein